MLRLSALATTMVGMQRNLRHYIYGGTAGDFPPLAAVGFHLFNTQISSRIMATIRNSESAINSRRKKSEPTFHKHNKKWKVKKTIRN